MDVETGSLNFLVLNYQILSGKQLGKLRLDFVANGHGSNTYGPIIQKKEVRRPPSRQFKNWSLLSFGKVLIKCWIIRFSNFTAFQTSINIILFV